MEINTKKTLVLGASPNPDRYSYQCILSLTNHQIPVVAVGLREGMAGRVPIYRGTPSITGIHTVTMYIGARNQAGYQDYILSLKPQRVIFNPGSENPVFEEILRKEGIAVIHSCTLMMLDYGDF
jgi:hypothetical protein